MEKIEITRTITFFSPMLNYWEIFSIERCIDRIFTRVTKIELFIKFTDTYYNHEAILTTIFYIKVRINRI